jgi:predicted small lipoprotein YifL
MRKLFCLLSIVITFTGCGKKGPLIYPDMLVPAAPSDVSAQQSGTSIKLSFLLPSKDLAGRNFAGITGVTIIKRDEPAGQSPNCSACTTDFSPFRKLNLDFLPPDTRRYGSLLVLMDGDVQTGRTYSYRISAVTKDNQEGTLSVPVATIMVPGPLPPKVQVISQPTEILLEFVGLPPLAGVITGYNVYRALKGEAFPFQPLNREPLAGNRFADVGLERGTSYIYGVRTVVRLPSGGRVESGLSNAVEGRLKDDE